MGVRFCILLFLFVGVGTHAQLCDTSSLNKELIEQKLIDTIYKVEVQNRIAYFANLNQEILPKYSGLKADILKIIQETDYSNILELKKAYNRNSQLLLDTGKKNQREHYQNINTYSILNTVLLKEVFDTFPDSYALLLNSVTAHIGNKESTLDLFDAIAFRYSNYMKPMIPCFTLLEGEVETARVDFKIARVLQGRKDSLGKEALDRIRTIDMLLWAIE